MLFLVPYTQVFPRNYPPHCATIYPKAKQSTKKRSWLLMCCPAGVDTVANGNYGR